MKPLIALIFTVIAYSSTQAQGGIKVLLVKGKVEKWAGKDKHGAVTSTGTVIGKNDTVRLYDDAQLVLTSDKKAMTLKVAGKYSEANLGELFSKQGSSELMAKFMTFLATEMKPEHENYQDFAKSHMKEKGSVSRGPGCAAPIMQFPVYGTVEVPDTLFFRWRKQDAKSFLFSLYTLPEDGPAMYKKTLTDTSINISVSELKLQFGKTYYWQATDTAKSSCYRMPFSMIDLDAANKLEAQMKQMKDLFSGGDDISLLAYAAMCEQSALYGATDAAYRKLITAYPSRDDIRQLYASFLGRMGLADEAQAALVKPKAIKDKK